MPVLPVSVTVARHYFLLSVGRTSAAPQLILHG